jgi:hypothetical protein
VCLSLLFPTYFFFSPPTDNFWSVWVFTCFVWMQKSVPTDTKVFRITHSSNLLCASSASSFGSPTPSFLFFFFFLFSISSPDLAFICSLCLPFYRYSTLFCIIIIGAERSDLQGACWEMQIEEKLLILLCSHVGDHDFYYK